MTNIINNLNNTTSDIVPSTALHTTSVVCVCAINALLATALTKKICNIAATIFPLLASSINQFEPFLGFVTIFLPPLFFSRGSLLIGQIILYAILRIFPSESKTSSSPSFLTDLTEETRKNPIATQESSLPYISEIKKNLRLGLLTSNIILLGKAGSGKTYTIQQIATQSHQDRASFFYGKTIFSLNVASLMSGTKYRGELENRLEQLMTYLKSKNDAILFIDEAHMLKGLGRAEGQNIDVLQFLKPLTDRPANQGGLSLILATTPEEASYLKEDKAFYRRLKEITIRERTKEELVEMTYLEMGRLLRKSGFSNIKFSYEVIEWVVSSVLKKTPDEDEKSQKLDQIAKVLIDRSSLDEEKVAPLFKALRLSETLFQEFYCHQKNQQIASTISLDSILEIFQPLLNVSHEKKRKKIIHYFHPVERNLAQGNEVSNTLLA